MDPRERHLEPRAGRTMRWRRIDIPGREEAQFDPAPHGWLIRGRLEVADEGIAAGLQYEIECDERWRTRSAVITGSAEGGQVALRVTADGEGHWAGDGEGLAFLDGALDVDLGFTPATNTLPIRRLALPVGGSARVRTAWFRFPELRLESLEQTYTREAERIYRYEALVDGELFTARLETDAFGVVVRYEGLWEPDSDPRAAEEGVGRWPSRGR